MTPTPVGMRCPECASQRTRVVRNPTGQASGFWAAPATYVLIAINVIVFLVEIASGGGGLGEQRGEFVNNFSLAGPFVNEGEYYRLLTSGFLHASFIHIGFNMLLLFFLGRLLEPALGTPRFVVLYFAALLAGSLGVMILDPNSLTLGASGAIFGLAGATFVIAQGRGMEQIASQVGFLIVFNLIYSFAASDVSIGAHIGGLIGGVVCAGAIVAGERGMLGRNRRVLEIAAMVLVGVVSVAVSIAIAQPYNPYG